MGEAASDVSGMHHVVSDDGDAGDHGGGKIDAHASSLSLSLSLPFSLCLSDTSTHTHTHTRKHSPVKQVFLFVFSLTDLTFSSLSNSCSTSSSLFYPHFFLDTEISNFSMRCAL